MLQKLEQERRVRRERLRRRTRTELRRALRQLVPGQQAIVFGSLTKPFRFGEHSDVDVALSQEPNGMSIYQLTSRLGERLGRRVDVVLLCETRLRDKILEEGETWTLPG